MAYDVPGASYWYKNNANEYGHLGKLYTYEAALKAVPPGWHLSTDEDWMDLERAIGMPDSMLQMRDEREANVARKIKQVGFDNWSPSINSDTNETGFSALAAGYGMLSDETGTNPEITFMNLKIMGSFLTSTLDSTQKFVLKRTMYNNTRGIKRQFIYKETTCSSVRCVKD